MSVPALPGGFLESTKEYTTDYYRNFYSDASLSLYYDYVELLHSYGFHLYDRSSLDGNEYATFTSDFIVVHAYYIACKNTISVLYTDIENWTPYETAPVSDGAVTNTVFAMASMDYDKDKEGESI